MQTPGLELARRFYLQAVAPIVIGALGDDADFAAALIGPGSEVLGFDTDRSRDHDWGPRCQLFLSGDAVAQRPVLEAALTAGLPAEFGGFATGFSASDGNDNRGAAGGPGELTHRVEVLDLDRWWSDWSGEAPGASRSVTSWLALPTQRLAELTGGAVFHDGPGLLTAARSSLRWYPHDLWRYVLACSWRRIADEQPFVGRCAEVGDELGSALLTGRLARDVMRLWLLLDRRYPPYSKWLGSAFAAVPGAGPVAVALTTAVAATDIAARERALIEAMSATIERQNAAAVCAPVPSTPGRFHSRPYLIVDADGAAAALMAEVGDAELAGAPARAAIDAVTDNIAVTGDIAATRRIVDALGTDR